MPHALLQTGTVFRTHLTTSDVHEAELWLSKLANDKAIDVLDVSECKGVEILSLLEKTVLADGGKHFEHIEFVNLGDCGLKKDDGELLALLLTENRTIKKVRQKIQFFSFFVQFF
jgi:hypothetical protein